MTGLIKQIVFRAGASPTSPALKVDAVPLTVFVGPNNSGKSRTLIEIGERCTQHGMSAGLVVDQVRFRTVERVEIESDLRSIVRQLPMGETVDDGVIPVEKLNPSNTHASTMNVNVGAVVYELNSGTLGYHAGQFLSLFTLRLDGTQRLSMVRDQSAGDLQQRPLNQLARLFMDNVLRAQVSQIIYEAFSMYLVVDPTNIGNLRLRLSNRPPSSEREEKGWESASVAFHSKASEISRASDGVKAFTGIITALYTTNPMITLIDEPEAFLHPALAARLGKEIGRSTEHSKHQVFVSTHSPNFLMGCIQSGVPVNIVRLTYDYEAATARLLPSEKLLHLMRNPLLRSTGVLSGLFFESVIVTESDSDRAFYQEINERLLSFKDKRAISNCLFLNAQNKQTVWDIVGPLRELGIPAAGIVDIDVLKEGGKVWSKPLEGAFIPSLSHASLQNQRLLIHERFTNTQKNMKRDGGISLLTGGEKEACENLFDSLACYGVFIVPYGELESWLKDRNVTGHGPNWLIDMFLSLGENPNTEDYVRPAEGDVWDFIGSINKWIKNPRRKGIPEGSK